MPAPAEPAAAPATDILVVSQSCLIAINRTPYRRLADMGWTVEIAVPERLTGPGFSRPADPRGPHDPPVHTLRLRGRNPRLSTYDQIGELLRNRRPRIVLLDLDPGSRLVLAVGRWARRNGARVACVSCDNMPRTLRGELGHSLGAAAKFLAARALAAAARGCVDHVFALSSDIVAVMRSVGFTGRVSWMPLGFDPGLFRFSEEARGRVRRRLGLSGPTVGYFGRLLPEKGVDVLLRALDGMRDRPWQLMIDEFHEYQHPYAREIAGLIDSLGLRDRVVFFDARHEEMPDYMNAADVVVVPSVSNPRWKEQYGRVAPEAMACGRTVIVSACGALPELVGDAGIVVPEHDPAALGLAISRALADPALRADYGRRAAQRAHERLSLVAQCTEMHRVFSQWCAPSRPASAAARARDFA